MAPFAKRVYYVDPQAKLPSLAEIRAELARREHAKQFKKETSTIEGTREACKKLSTFVKKAWGILHPGINPDGSYAQPYRHGWHIDFICDHLEALTFGKFKEVGYENRLGINEPPGTMKSLLVNVFWQAWEWGPADRAWMSSINTSYKAENCTRDVGRLRDLLLSEWYQKHWPLELTRTGEWHITNGKRGDVKGVPFRSLTQWRADRLKIDDPHSVDTAESDTDRAKTTITFRESATSRLNDPISSAIILIMQRLNEYDLSGVIKKLGLNYLWLHLPMEFELSTKCTTPFGEDRRTFEGELLFPERFPREVVERDKKVMGPYAVAGQFQQRPAPRSGGMFKRQDFKIVAAVPAEAKKRRCRGWDFAATLPTPGKDPDWTVGIRMSTHEGLYYIEDMIRFRDIPSKVRQSIRNCAALDGPHCHITIPKDPGQAGKDQSESIIKENAGKRIYAIPPSGDKAIRAEPFAAQVEAGNVSLVEGPWNEDYIHEMTTFPAGHDDIVDASSDCFNHLTSKKRFPPLNKDIIDKASQPGTKLMAKLNPIGILKPRVVLGRMKF
jgi:predicted phage terminase large subunit-like protein